MYVNDKKDKEAAKLEDITTEDFNQTMGLFKSEKVKKIDGKFLPVDQTYNAESENAQSGVAVNEAIAHFSSELAELSGKAATIAVFNITEENTSVRSYTRSAIKKDWGDGTINNESYIFFSLFFNLIFFLLIS